MTNSRKGLIGIAAMTSIAVIFGSSAQAQHRSYSEQLVEKIKARVCAASNRLPIGCADANKIGKAEVVAAEDGCNASSVAAISQQRSVLDDIVKKVRHPYEHQACFHGAALLREAAADLMTIKRRPDNLAGRKQVSAVIKLGSISTDMTFMEARSHHVPEKSGARLIGLNKADSEFGLGLSLTIRKTYADQTELLKTLDGKSFYMSRQLRFPEGANIDDVKNSLLAKYKPTLGAPELEQSDSDGKRIKLTWGCRDSDWHMPKRNWSHYPSHRVLKCRDRERYVFVVMIDSDNSWKGNPIRMIWYDTVTIEQNVKASLDLLRTEKQKQSKESLRDFKSKL